MSVIGIFFYIQFKQAQFDKDMKTQKENYDKEFTALDVRITANGYFKKSAWQGCRKDKFAG